MVFEVRIEIQRYDELLRWQRTKEPISRGHRKKRVLWNDFDCRPRQTFACWQNCRTYRVVHELERRTERRNEAASDTSSQLNSGDISGTVRHCLRLRTLVPRQAPWRPGRCTFCLPKTTARRSFHRWRRISFAQGRFPSFSPFESVPVHTHRRWHHERRPRGTAPPLDADTFRRA